MEPLPWLNVYEAPVARSRSLALPWLAAAMLLTLVTLVTVIGVASVAFQSSWEEVDVAELPAGTTTRTFDQATGPLTTAECPALVGSSGTVPSWCVRTEAERTRTARIVAVVAVVAAVGALLAFRRAWSLWRERRRPVVWPPTSYRQEGMPGSFWLALGLVGGLTLLIDGVVLVDLLAGDGSAGPMGAIFWTLILGVIVARYGWGKAVVLELDGPDLVWRAPLRTLRVPRVQIVGWSRSGGGPIGERPAQLHLADGTLLPIAVPNHRHELVLEAFLTTVAGGAAAVPQPAGSWF